jgi:branched-chain amino acid transport system permease protein
MTRKIPWALLVFVLALFVPAAGSRYYTFLANDVVIWGALRHQPQPPRRLHRPRLLRARRVLRHRRLRHGHPHEEARGELFLAFPAAGIIAGLFALLFGFFCVRLTRIYFAMLTLAFAQIVWAICFKWNEVTGGEQGMPEIPYPDFGWIDRVAAFLPFLGGYRTAEHFYFVTLVLVAACLVLLRRVVGSPFGRMLATIRENPERAEFIGVNVRRYELAAFVLAGAFAGLAGGLFGIFNRGVFPDFAYWTKSSEVLIMTLLGGMGAFFGPALGAAVLIWLNQQIVSYTEYWPLVLGTILVVLLFVFPGGIAGALVALRQRVGRGTARA